MNFGMLTLVFQCGSMVCLVQADRITVQDENEPERFKSG